MQRIGFGYDIHPFDHRRRVLVLAGVKIDRARGLAGHSDGDAVLHALTDAILGAAGVGDIGEHFPDTDPQWAGADSALFVRKAVEVAAAAGLRVGNCDVTVIAQTPRLLEHKPAMRASIAALLGVEVERVSVKAKTNNGMGTLGQGKGIAALAAVLLEKSR